MIMNACNNSGFCYTCRVEWQGLVNVIMNACVQQDIANANN